MEWALVLIALAVLAVAAVSGRLSGTMATPAMAFVAIGLVLGPKVLGEVEPSTNGEAVRTLAEATLALVLFSDASRINLGVLRRQAGVPLRLLAVGLPLTIVLGALAAAMFDNMTLGEVLVLGVCGHRLTRRSARRWSPCLGCRRGFARGSTSRAG